MEFKQSAAIDVELQHHEQRKQLTVDIAGAETPQSCLGDAQTCLYAAMNSLGTDVEGVLSGINGALQKLRKDLSALARDGIRAGCEELITHSVADFTVLPVSVPTAAGSRPLPAGEVAPPQGIAHLHLDVVPSKQIPYPTVSDAVRTFDNAVVDIIGDVSPFHSSASPMVEDFAPSKGTTTKGWWSVKPQPLQLCWLLLVPHSWIL